MLGIYLFAMVVGVGLLLFSILGGGDSDVDAPDVDVDIDADVDFDGDLSPAGAVGDVVLGLFRPRNLTFLLAAFGTTGALLTWTRGSDADTLLLASAMGAGAWMLSHAVFTWLRRTDSGIEALSDRDLEGSIGTVTLPIVPGSRGRVTIVIAGRQTYLTARLEPGVTEALAPGTEVLIRRTDNGVAEVIPTASLDLPPSAS